MLYCVSTGSVVVVYFCWPDRQRAVGGYRKGKRGRSSFEVTRGRDKVPRHWAIAIGGPGAARLYNPSASASIVN